MDDMARACVHVMMLDKAIYYRHTQPMCSHINVGSGFDLSIKNLAEIIKAVVGYEGDIDFDSSKPDGSPRKFLDSRRLSSLGWTPEIELEDGLAKAYTDYMKAQNSEQTFRTVN